MPEIVLRAEGLEKRYGTTVALRGVDLEIEAGGVVGLVGPNGAGKTTLVEIAEGLREPSSGRITVFGLDPARAGARLRERIGVQLQATSLPDRLRVAETLRLFAAFYSDARPVDEVLEQVGLSGAERQFTDDLSGGQRQRLSLGMALVHDPELLLLDEPTTGLDPEGRRRLHADIEALRDEGRTVLLTTHYIEEAERMADRVGVIRRGEIILVDETASLMKKLGRKHLSLQLQETMAELPESLDDWSLTLADSGRRLDLTLEGEYGEDGVEAGWLFSLYHPPLFPCMSSKELRVVPGEIE